MTNTGTGISGNVGRPQKHNETALKDWLGQHFNDLPFWRREMILNRMQTACKYWYQQGGDDAEQFEQLFEK